MFAMHTSIQFSRIKAICIMRICFRSFYAQQPTIMRTYECTTYMYLAIDSAVQELYESTLTNAFFPFINRKIKVVHR